MLNMPGGLPADIISGNTVFYLTKVGDQAYYIPRGYILEDELYCWRVKVDRETGQIYFVNCAGLGKTLKLPDVFTNNYRLAIQKLNGGEKIISSPPVPSSIANTRASYAIATVSMKENNNNNNGNFSILSSSEKTSQKPIQVQNNFSTDSTHKINKEKITDIYANDIMYLQTFDETNSTLFSPPEAYSNSENSLRKNKDTDNISSPLTAQLRKIVEDYSEENIKLHQKLKEQERLNMEKDAALVTLEELIVNMRLRMVEALSAYRKNKEI